MAGRRGRRTKRTTTPPAARLDEHYKRVAREIVDQIERGTAPWTQAWKPGERSLPANVSTGRTYRGGNSVWLAGRSHKLGFSDHRWGTYRQVRELGGHVRRGEKGTSIVVWKFDDARVVRDAEGRPVRDDDGDAVREVRRLQRPLVRTYTVFNAEQCDGLPARPTPGKDWQGIELADRLLAGSGAEIQHTPADRAIYDLRRDRIVLPHQERFDSAPGYYQCALHELGHWTGHEDRLNRAMLRQGIMGGEESPAYAREEMRAEISSMITGDRLNLGHDPRRSAAYVENWVKSLEKEPEEIYRASKDAQDISDYLFDRARMRDVFERPEEGRAPQPAAPRPEPAQPPPAPDGPAGEQLRLFQRRPAPGSLVEQARQAVGRARERSAPSR